MSWNMIEGERKPTRNLKKKPPLGSVCSISLIKKSSIAETDVESLPELFQRRCGIRICGHRRCIGGMRGDRKREQRETKPVEREEGRQTSEGNYGQRKRERPIKRKKVKATGGWKKKRKKKKEKTRGGKKKKGTWEMKGKIRVAESVESCFKRNTPMLRTAQRKSSLVIVERSRTLSFFCKREKSSWKLAV